MSVSGSLRHDAAFSGVSRWAILWCHFAQYDRKTSDTIFAMPDPISPKLAKQLAVELAALYKEQFKALQTADFILMSAEDVKDYERRRMRIRTISGLLATVRPLRNGLNKGRTMSTAPATVAVISDGVRRAHRILEETDRRWPVNG